MSVCGEIAAISEVRAQVAAASSVAEVCRSAVDEVRKVVGCDTCELFVERSGTLVLEASSPAVQEDGTGGQPMCRGIATRVFRSQEPLVIGDATENDQCCGDDETGYRSGLAVPVGDHGVLSVADPTPDVFDEQSLALLDVLGGYIAQVLEDVSNQSPLSPTPAQRLPSPERFSRALEAADMMVVMLDTDGQVTFSNRRARELLGYDEGELLGVDWLASGVPAQNRDAISDTFNQVLSGERDRTSAEMSITTTGGCERVVGWQATCLQTANGEITGAVITGTEITEQKTTQRKLREERQKYSALVENANDGITIIQDGEFKFVNEGFAELHDTTPDDLIGEPFLNYIDPEYEDVVRERYTGRIAGEEKPTRYEIEILDGKRTLEINATRIEYEGRPADMGIVRDVTDRKEREQELKQYEAIIETVTDGICVLNRDSEFVMVNDAFVNLTNASRDELIGTHSSAVRPAELNDVLDEMQESLDAGSNIESIEMEIHPDESEPRVIEARYAQFENDGGSGRVGVWRDITDRKRAESELRDRGAQLSQAQEMADLGSWHLDVQANELDWSEEVNQLFQRSEDGSIDFETFLEYVHPEDRAYVEEQWDAALGGAPYDIEHRIEVNGETRWVREKAALQFDDDGTPLEAIGVVQDITERKQREMELETARRRYQTLLQAAPNPIFVANAESGEIIETNQAAQEFRGQSREELIGLDQSELHPPDNRDKYRELFEHHLEDGGTKRRCPDGSLIYAVTAEGERIPVEISVGMTELEDSLVMYGVFRDISDQLDYESALTGLNEATRELFGTETTDDIADQIVTAATDVLNLAGAGVFRFDESTGVLRPTTHALSAEVDEQIDEMPSFEPGEGIAWEVFVDADDPPVVVDDVRSHENVYNPETIFQSEIFVPLGDWGVLIVGDTETNAFDGRAVMLVEILAATAKTALERVERIQQRKKHEQQLKHRARQLEQVEAINSQVRDIARTVVRSDTRAEIEQSVCTQLAATDPITVASITAIDPVENSLTQRTIAGDDKGYLEQISLSLDDEADTNPVVQAARTNEPVMVPNTAKNMTQESWRREAIKREFQSVLSIPLVYQETIQGVLTLFSSSQSTFSGVLRTVLVELGELIAHAVVAIKRKQALLSDQVTELEFNIQDLDCLFFRFAQETGCTLELEGITPQAKDETLVFVSVPNGSPDRLLERAERAPEVTNSRHIETDEDPLVQLRFTEPFIGSILAAQGLTLRDISSSSSGCRVTVAVPPSVGIHRAVDVVTTTYPQSELRAKREQTDLLKAAESVGEQALTKLTGRQREVVEMAYRNGYFESPRGVTGEEIADHFDFSTSAFHAHVRAAERKLFETVFENRAESTHTASK